jgi:hypothetical protein
LGEECLLLKQAVLDSTALQNAIVGR